MEGSRWGDISFAGLNSWLSSVRGICRVVFAIFFGHIADVASQYCFVRAHSKSVFNSDVVGSSFKERIQLRAKDAPSVL